MRSGTWDSGRKTKSRGLLIPPIQVQFWFFWGAVLLSWGVGIRAFSSDSAPLSLFQFQEACMGTRFTIQVYAESEAKVAPAVARAWKRLDELNQRFSDYDPESELMRLCRQPPGVETEVSAELHAVLADSQRIAQITHGAFDVTIGPLKRLWKQSCRDCRLPSANQLAKAMSLTGPEKLQIHSEGTVSLAVTGMRLDLGGIAKGFAARDLIRVFTESGFPSVLVAASGDIAVGAPPPGKDGWTVGIVTPERSVLLPPWSAISTSGDSEQFVEIEGKRYSHILDPRTGLGITHGTQVSVRGPDPVMTDALATAVSVLGGTDRLPEKIREDYSFLLLPSN